MGDEDMWASVPNRTNPNMLSGLQRYYYDGIPPGSFLVALLSNDLVGTFGKADMQNSALIREWVMWLQSDFDRNAWGNAAIVQAWITIGGRKGHGPVTWNYRLIIHDLALNPKDHWIGLHEVYYDDEAPTSWTETAIAFQCGREEGPESLVRSLEQALNDARNRPVLKESELRH